MPTAKNIHDFNLNYEIHGNPKGKHAIVFAHGNGNCLEDWKNLGFVSKLALALPNTCIIIMDALGYGKSDKPTHHKHYTPEERAKDVIAVLKHADISEATFFGNSIGGSLGFVLADLYPEYFNAFIIGSAHPYGNAEPIGCNLFDENFRNTMKEHGMKALVLDLEEKYLQRKFHDAVRPLFLQNDAAAIIAANTPTWPDRSDKLSRIAVPVLLFAGDKDPVSGFQAAIAEHIPDSMVTILKDTDHADAYWGSDRVVPLIVRFIKAGHSI